MSDLPPTKRARSQEESEGAHWSLVTFEYDNETCNYSSLLLTPFPSKADALDRLLVLACAALYCVPLLGSLELEDSSMESFFGALEAAHTDKDGVPRRDVDWGALLPADVRTRLTRVGGFKVDEHCGACIHEGPTFRWLADYGGGYWSLRTSGVLALPGAADGVDTPSA